MFVSEKSIMVAIVLRLIIFHICIIQITICRCCITIWIPRK